MARGRFLPLRRLPLYVLRWTHLSNFLLRFLILMHFRKSSLLFTFSHIFQPLIIRERILIWLPCHDIIHGGLSVSSHITQPMSILIPYLWPFPTSHPTAKNLTIIVWMTVHIPMISLIGSLWPQHSIPCRSLITPKYRHRPKSTIPSKYLHPIIVIPNVIHRLHIFRLLTLSFQLEGLKSCIVGKDEL